MINALRYTEELEKVGFTPEQAKKSVDTWMTLMNQNFATRSDFREHQLVFKKDMLELRAEFKSDIAELRTEVKSDIAELRAEFKSDITKLRDELKADIAALANDLAGLKKEFCELKGQLSSLEQRMTIKLGGMMGLGITLLSTLMVLLN